MVPRYGGMVVWCYDGRIGYLSWDRFLVVLEEHDDGLQRDVQVRKRLLRQCLRVFLAHHLRAATLDFQGQFCCAFSSSFPFPFSTATVSTISWSSAGFGSVASRLDERVRLYLVLQDPHRL